MLFPKVGVAMTIELFWSMVVNGTVEGLLCGRLLFRVGFLAMESLKRPYINRSPKFY